MSFTVHLYLVSKPEFGHEELEIWRKFTVRRFSTNLLVLLIVATLVLAACAVPGRPAQEGEEEAVALAAPLEEEETVVPVEIALVETGDIALVFSYSGTLQPKDEVNIAPGAAGRIESVLVEVGDQVKAGEPIAIIEDDTHLIQIKQAAAALTSAKLNLAKMELGTRPEEIAASQAAVELARASLNDTATIDDDERTRAAATLANTEAALRTTQAEYDKIAWAGDIGSTPQAAALQQATIAYETALANYNLNTNPSDSQLAPLMLQLAQAELNLALKANPFREIDFEVARVGIHQAEIALELANLQLDETTIQAPFDGIIAELHIAEGSRVSPQAPVVLLMSSELEALVDVQENLISQVSENQNASLQVTAYPNQDFPGVVTRISPQANPDTRTFKVTVTPTGGAELLRSGMFADVSILAKENTNTILAPQAAIISGGNEPLVFVVNEDNIAEQRTVTTGLFDSDRIEILSGLQASDLVVTAGQTNLFDGMKVEIINDPRIAE
jgi:HlyD family secretion protein